MRCGNLMDQRPQNILWLIDGLGMGGAERLMIPYLCQLDKSQFRSRVCVLQERDGNPMADQIRQLGVPVDLLLMPHLRNLDNIPRLLRYLRQHQIDLVHTQLEFANIMGTLAARLEQIPTLCTLHTFEDIDQSAKTTRRVRLMWQVLRRFSQRIIAVSEEIRQYHIRQAYFDPDKIITLYNGINLSRFRQLPGSTRDDLGIPSDAPLLLTVAVLRQPKGIQYMIEAMLAILTAVPDTRYVIVGDGEYAQPLQQLAQQQKVSDRIIFTGIRHDVPQLLAASDLFVLPTLLDALPTVLIEALAAGKPIVASDVGGVPEIVVHGRNGLLVPPAQPDELAQACLQLLLNGEMRAAMGCVGQEVAAQRFDIRNQVKRLGDIYLEILA